MPQLIKYYEANFQLSFLEDVIMPKFIGSSLRGVLGQVLKNLDCRKLVKCKQECLLKNECAYGKFYSDTDEIYREIVLILPNEIKSFYKEGEGFTFGFRIFNSDLHLYTKILTALYLSQEYGLGISPINGEYVSYSLTLLNGENTKEKERYIQSIEPYKKETGLLLLKFITPIRSKKNGVFMTSLNFNELNNLILRRLSFFLFKNNEDYLRKISLDIKNINEVNFSTRLKWIDYDRYSSKQALHLKLGGLIGECEINNYPKGYYELLKVAELLHIGKQTTFGFGQFRVYKYE